MDHIFSGQLLFSTLVLGALYMVAALGLNLVYGTLRLLNVAHGDIAMLGAYLAFWGFTLAGISPLLSLPATALLGIALAWLLHRLLLTRGPLAPRPFGGVILARLEANSLLVFIGLSVIVQNLAALAFTGSPRAYRYLDEVHQIAGIAMTGHRLAALAVAAAIGVATLLVLRYSRYGLAIKALIENPVAAEVVGIDVARLRLAALMAGFALAGIAGGLISMSEQISPFMGFPVTIASFIVIILGGLGNLRGGMISAFLLAIVQIYGVALTSPSYGSVLLYGVFVGVLLIRPEGLLASRPSVR
jgi:branched-chain amino acid transport system permease protein